MMPRTSTLPRTPTSATSSILISSPSTTGATPEFFQIKQEDIEYQLLSPISGSSPMTTGKLSYLRQMWFFFHTLSNSLFYFVFFKVPESSKSLQQLLIEQKQLTLVQWPKLQETMNIFPPPSQMPPSPPLVGYILPLLRGLHQLVAPPQDTLCCPMPK